MFDQRATFYFSEEQIHRLDVLHLELRTKDRLKVGKSELARFFIEQGLAKYNSQRSEFVEALKAHLEREEDEKGNEPSPTAAGEG